MLQIGPGLTLDHPAVELFEARRRRFEEQPRPEAARAAQDAFSAALVERPDAVGPRLRAYERTILDTRDDAARAPVQEAAARNIFIRVGRAALVRGKPWFLGRSAAPSLRFLRAPAPPGSRCCSYTASPSPSGSCRPSRGCRNSPRWRSRWTPHC
ncbi:MAG: hypothetical protein JKP98_10655 [Rhodobacteraceae bacterium]|nr:hypothetical protein [Paracoccaceae bacterium]